MIFNLFLPQCNVNYSLQSLDLILGVFVLLYWQMGWTPLHNASDEGHLEVVAILLSAGAQKEIVNDVSYLIVRLLI